MCVNPLKGFVYDNHVVKVSRDAKHIRLVNGVWKSFYDSPYPDSITTYIDLPCRTCVECITIMRKEWTCRAIAEAQLHNKMCFITLTYDDSNIRIVKTVDDDGVIYNHSTLCHRDWQLFMYRLRQYFNDRSLRFLMCGEYGSKTFRPHYHAIIYGLSIDDFPDLRVQSVNKNNDLLYKSDWLSLNMWQLGFCMIGDCNSATCGYVAGYVDKKFTHIRGKKFYELTGIVAPYIRSSNRPGLGTEWLIANMDRYKSIHDYVSVSNGLSDPTRIYLTENWRKKYENNMLTDKDLSDILLYIEGKDYHRSLFSDKRLDIERRNSDMSKDEYLKSKEDRFIQSRKMKVRDF